MEIFEDKFAQLEKLLAVEPELRNPSQLGIIQNILLTFPLFTQLYRDFHVNNIVDCAIYFTYSRFSTGQCVFAENQPAQNFYVLLQGEVSIYKRSELIRKYTEGVFEECSLFERRKYDTTAISTQESHIVFIDYQIYSGLLMVFREKRRIALVSFLQVQKAFKNWKKAQLMGLSYFIHVVEVKEGKVVYEIGENADKVFIVHDGNVAVKGKTFKICTAGEVAGLEEMEKGGKRTERCVSQTASTLLFIFRHDYLEKAPKKESFFGNFARNNRPIQGLVIQSYSPELKKAVKALWDNEKHALRPSTTTWQRPRSGLASRPRTSYGKNYSENSISRRINSQNPHKTQKIVSFY